MMPQQLTKMFGIKDSKDLSMANNIWKMLDEMAEFSPENYKQFIQKNVKEGLTDIQAKKQQADKPFKFKPIQGFKIQMDCTINEQSLIGIPNTLIHQKLNLNSKQFLQIKSKFPKSVQFILNICHSDRVKMPTLKNNEQIKDNKITLLQLKMIQNFYYSLQGPQEDKQATYFCMILNSYVYQSIVRQGGKKILLGLTLSYFQQRIKADKNPLKGKFDAIKFAKNIFYTIDKQSIQINDVKFFWKGSKEMVQFLLEKEVDNKRALEESKTVKQQIKHPSTNNQKIEIKFKKQENQNKVQPPLLLSQNKPKKVLIEVISETVNPKSDQIPFEMQEMQNGYHFEFTVEGISSINQLNLEVSQKAIKMKTQDGRHVQVNLIKKINQNQVKAKLKKKTNKLIVDLNFKL